MIEYITEQGKEMLSNMIAGNVTITFTKIEIGDGQLITGEDRTTRTNLINKKAEISIDSTKIGTDKVVIITGIYNNTGLEEGFYFREKGIYASDGTNTVLFSYANVGDKADYISPSTEETIEKKLVTIIKQFQDTETPLNITIKSGVYALNSDLQELMEEVESLKISGSEKKATLVSNLTAMGVNCNINETWQSLLGKIVTIFTGTDVSDSTVMQKHVVSGIKFHVSDGSLKYGSMKPGTIALKGNGNDTAFNTSYICGSTNNTYVGVFDYKLGDDEYYYIGNNQRIQIANLLPSNIKYGTKVGGKNGYIQGTYTEDATITPEKILEGAIGYAKGEQVVGGIKSIQASSYSPKEYDQQIPAGKYLEGAQTIKKVETETKTITPTSESQTVLPSTGKYLSKVIVNGYSGKKYASGSLEILALDGTEFDASSYTGTNYKCTFRTICVTCDFVPSLIFIKAINRDTNKDYINVVVTSNCNFVQGDYSYNTIDSNGRYIKTQLGKTTNVPVINTGNITPLRVYWYAYQ